MRSPTVCWRATLTLLAALAPASIAAQQDYCSALATYRDGALFQQWDVAIQRADIYSQQRTDLVQIRQKLEGDTFWTQDWLLLTGLIASNVKATTDLIANLAAFAPVDGVTTVTSDVIQTVLDGQDLVQSAASDGFGNAITIYVSAKLNPVGQAYKTVHDLAQDVKKGVYLPNQRDELRATLTQELDNVDAALAKNDANIAKWTQHAAQLNAVKVAIDTYYGKHCAKHKH